MKSRQLLIDAHNLMHRHPQIKKLLVQDHLEAMRELCRLTAGWCAANKRKATVVFDGVPQLIPGTYARVKVRFSRERTADEVIISIISANDASRHWTVVTDDTEIRQKAFFYSVDVLRCDIFLSQLRQLNPAKGSSATSATPAQKRAHTSDALRDPGELAEPKGLERDADLFLRLFKESK